LLGVDVYFFLEHRGDLWGFAVGTVEGEGLGEVFALTLDLDAQAFLVEVVARDPAVQLV
jgi:hypothetical protein